MKAADLGELALRNLRESILRNSLTTLGIAVGVASLVAMLSLGVGLQQLANNRIEHSGLFDTIFVMPKSNFQGFGRPAQTKAPKPLEARLLDDGAREEMGHLANVLEVYPQVRFATEVRYNGSPYTAMVTGVPQSAGQGGAFDGIQGRFFSNSNADEAILQADFAKELSDNPATLIGKDLVLRYAERGSLSSQSGAADAADDPADEDVVPGFSVIPREKKLRIVGVVENDPSGGFGGGFNGGRVFLPLDLAAGLKPAQMNDLRDIVRGASSKPTYANLTVRAKSPSQVEGVESAIKRMGFATFSLMDATRNIRLFFAVFDSLLAIFGSLALAVATLGIVNTLVMAILERRREIGVLKALGAADLDVKELFFVEAGLMGLVGGIFGVAFGWLIGRAVTVGTNIYLEQHNLPAAHVFSVPWWLVLGAIGFAIVVSLAAGLYPASRAARLNPVEALRYE